MIVFFEKALKAPWSGKKSIYQHIREQGDAVDGTLPDDDEFWGGNRIRWVAGGMDGVLTHHAGSRSKAEAVRKLVQSLAKHSRKPKMSTRKALYGMLMSSDALGVVDDVLEEVRNFPGAQLQTLFGEAVWMVEHAAHRNVVKYGIALLGLFNNAPVKDLLLTVGKHEEFTLYAAVAIRNGMEHGNDVLFELAQRVHGWGKIHIVERLEPARQEIKDWLLRNGCRNSIMNEYLAYTCAVKGGLREALSAARVDAELFEGASEIIQALLVGGPAEDIDDYEHAQQVISDYLRLAEEMGESPFHLSVIISIRNFLEEDERWEKRLTGNWTEELRASCLKTCRRIIARPGWESVVMRAVQFDDFTDRYYGIRCAHELGLDVWEHLFAQLAEDPLQDSLYFELMKSGDPARIRKLAQFAEERLPLAEIAAGPADELGLGPQFLAHHCLDFILQSLDRHEGVGEALILTGLRSPVVRNRNMALAALEAWDVSAWGPRIREEVLQLSEMEPNDGVKQRLRDLIAAKGLTPPAV